MTHPQLYRQNKTSATAFKALLIFSDLEIRDADEDDLIEPSIDDDDEVTRDARFLLYWTTITKTSSITSYTRFFTILQKSLN